MTQRTPARPFRSREWFDAPGRPDMTALYLERYMNDAFTREELRCGKPIIGISQSGSDLVPCNRVHLKLVERIKAGIRDAGGIPMEFPLHPIFENCRRPTAALDRNLAYLGLVEILNGYPIDYYDRYGERITAVAPPQVAEVAKKYIRDDQMVVVVVAPAESVKSQLERLGKVEVIPMPK